MTHYCTRCGSALAERPPATCTACGTAHWRNPKPCGAALVRKGTSLLLVRRAHAPWHGAWNLPSGFCDPTEHPLVTAEREALEEAGVRVRVTGYLGTWLAAYADDPTDDDCEIVSVAYYHAVPDGDGGRHSRQPDAAEVSETRWFDPDELPANLAPPEVLPLVLAAWRRAVQEGRTESELPDTPPDPTHPPETLAQTHDPPWRATAAIRRDVELTDGVVSLRRFRQADMPRIVEACADADTVRFVPAIPVPYGEREATAYIDLAEALWSGGKRLPFAVADAITDVLVGAIDIRLGDSASVGYWTHPDARGGGIATRALVLLSRWALTVAAVERLALTTHPDNRASQRVAEKAGFVREGVLRSHMRFHMRFRDGRRDSVLFSLLPSDL